MAPARVAIVGTGLVGSTAAYALLIPGMAAELILVDRDRARAEGQTNDLRDAALFAHPTRVIAGDFADCAMADVIIITVGVHQSTSLRSRLDDLEESAAMVRQVVGAIMAYDPKGIFVIASNPVDILTRAVWKWSGLTANRVMGSGTTLDTSRFRWRIAQRYGVATADVNAYILGEHGDSQVAVISSASLAGLPLDRFCATVGMPHEPGALIAIADDTRAAGLDILRAKGATYFGIGAALVRIVGAILRDEHAVLTVSCAAPPTLDLGDVCLSLPAIINRTGIAQILPPALDAAERNALTASAEVLKRYNATLDGARAAAP